MADIGKCGDSLCPSKLICKRFTAPSGLFQYYIDTHREDDAYNCDMFLHNEMCKYCGQYDKVHKMSCETRKIQINL